MVEAESAGGNPVARLIVKLDLGAGRIRLRLRDAAAAETVRGAAGAVGAAGGTAVAKVSAGSCATARRTGEAGAGVAVGRAVGAGRPSGATSAFNVSDRTDTNCTPSSRSLSRCVMVASSSCA